MNERENNTLLKTEFHSFKKGLMLKSPVNVYINMRCNEIDQLQKPRKICAFLRNVMTEKGLFC